MQISDTIADMLTRIRNASSAKHESVDVPASNMKKSIAQILVDEGYVKSFQVIDDGKQGVIRLTLKYNAGKAPAITGLKRVSKPGLRIYANCEDLPQGHEGPWYRHSFHLQRCNDRQSSPLRQRRRRSSCFRLVRR